MLDAAQKIVTFTENKSRQELENDDLLALAIERALEIVGEAAKQISEDIKIQHPEVRWDEITATRNRLIHGYFDVDLEIVWMIIEKDLPPLIQQLSAILGK
jgi:uncharacterized protein with HEPN domain